MISLRVLVAALALAAALCAGRQAVAEWTNPKANIPPRAKPTRISGAEGFPPLPLPATPLRRSETKRQPAPPALVGMINFSTKTIKAADPKAKVFPTTQIDIETLMLQANSQLKLNYRYVPTSLEEFSWDPAELPLLYVTGWTPMPHLSDTMIQKLRRYLYDGGTLVLHAQCGRTEFIDSAIQEIQRILPQRQLVRVENDSPLFNAFHSVKTVRVYKDHDQPQHLPPFLEAVYIGCRPAIIFSRVDLNCGWDVAAHPIDGGILYHQDDGARMGINIIATVLADFQYARAFGVQTTYPEQNDKTRDQLVIAQVRHEGDWDPTPHALPNLVKYIRKNTTLNVQFARKEVELKSVDVFKHPVLYMTGLRDFVFSDAEVATLRNYLSSGGVLIADAAAGKAGFDVAFRREIRRVLPGAELKVLDANSPVFQMPFSIQGVQYTELVRQQDPSLTAPHLEGITLDGQVAVIYSPLSLSNGWEQLGYAYNRGYSDNDALRLGVNVFAYALTH